MAQTKVFQRHKII